MRLTFCLGILFFALLAPRALASAANCAAPPGTSGIDEYCEVLPTPGGSGSHHSGGGGGANHGTSKNRVPAATQKQLQNKGDAGSTVLELAQSAPTAPTTSTPTQKAAPTTTHRSHHRRHSSSGGSSQPSTSTPQASAVQAPAAPASNPASAVGNSFGGSLGAACLVLLAGIAVVMAGVAWLGRRRRPAES
jgi:hypothetical protein